MGAFKVRRYGLGLSCFLQWGVKWNLKSRSLFSGDIANVTTVAVRKACPLLGKGTALHSHWIHLSSIIPINTVVVGKNKKMGQNVADSGKEIRKQKGAQNEVYL